MNENTTDARIIKNKPRCKKLKPKIDLAAMVSVSFLLIIFFMVNAELSKPQAMDFGIPDGGCGPYRGNICGGGTRERTITLLLDDDNKIISYRGILEYPEGKPKKVGYGKNGIRKELLMAKKQILEYTGDVDRGAIVLIKPSKKSNYGNLVDILDEMAINNIRTYAVINDYTPEEIQLLVSK